MELDRTSLTLKLGADIPWKDAEAYLSQRELTLGFGPPILQGDGGILTIGALLTAGSICLKSTLYGTPGERCLALSARIAGEDCRTVAVSRSAAGLDFKALILGADGAHSTLQTAWMRVTPKAEAIECLSFDRLSPHNLVLMFRKLIQNRITPAIALGIGEGGHWSLHLQFEGARLIVEARLAIATRYAKELGVAISSNQSPLPGLEAELFDGSYESPLSRVLSCKKNEWLLEWSHLVEALTLIQGEETIVLGQPVPEGLTLFGFEPTQSQLMSLSKLGARLRQPSVFQDVTKVILGDLRPSPPLPEPTP